jgi:hypothetical protein
VRAGRTESSGLVSSWSRKLRAQRGHHLHRTGQGVAQQLGEAGPLLGPGLGEQLLELIHHDQQVPAASPGHGEEQVVNQPGEVAVVEAAAHAGHSPPQAELVGGCGQLAAQRGHGLCARQDRRQRPPVLIGRHHRQQTRPHQRRFSAPGRADDEQHRAFGLLGG